MKMHVLLVALACVLIFGCNGEKHYRTLDGAKTAPEQQAGNPSTTPAPGEKKCVGSKCKMIITLDLKENDIDAKVKVKKEHGGNDVSITKISDPNAPGEHPVSNVIGIGTIFYTHSSPGCVYYNFGGWWWYVCE